ncbi:MAG: ABC-F family ATP-binding cassette domain-containing protein [Anaerolineales bacterium]
MSLLIGSQLAKSFGAEDIFGGVTISLPHDARVALVGPNGAGKTTLLRLLAGLDEPSSGTVQVAKGVRIGYLPQEARFDSDKTLWDEMLTAFSAVREREAELRQLELAMADRAQHAAAMEKYGPLQHQFELDGGYAYETRIKQVLAGLNFEAVDYGKRLKIFSGGQKTRALLARLLLESPDLLILDEPTTHLDLHAIEWLETWLNEWRGAVLIVSHDRYFMDRVARHVWALEHGTLTEYRGNYSAYILQREERQARQQAEFASQQAFFAKEMDFIRRNMAGQNTRQAKGRLRRLERGLHNGSAIVQPVEMQTIRLRMEADSRSGDRVLETHDLAVGYSDNGRVLFRAPDVLLWRGECAALIGPNGAGKSTFLKTVLGQLPPLAGTAKLGSNLKIGYFAQAHEGLQPERTVIEEIQASQEMPSGKARDYAAKFLFTGDDAYKKVAVLSGGERGRLALAKLALTGANLLLLDEPTNHLDIPSQEILEAVLSDFDGTILLVSHDRYLIDDLATQVWAVETGALEIFKGNWSEYVEWRAAQATEDEGRKTTPEFSNLQSSPKTISKNEERRRAARASELEALIATLERRKAEVTAAMEAAGTDFAKTRALGEDYERLETEIAACMDEWSQIAL